MKGHLVKIVCKQRKATWMAVQMTKGEIYW